MITDLESNDSLQDIITKWAKKFSNEYYFAIELLRQLKKEGKYEAQRTVFKAFKHKPLVIQTLSEIRQNNQNEIQKLIKAKIDEDKTTALDRDFTLEKASRSLPDCRGVLCQH